MTDKRNIYDENIEVPITDEDRALILEHTFIDPEIEQLLNLAVQHGTKYVVKMTLGDLDILLGHIAATANHAKNQKIEKEMDRIYWELKEIEDREV
ncbi:MAG: hypothetical protein U5K31_10630 [Balneolaceae bacterium]|nr:hypothetical protein [Balneolaceae bacterium]